MVSADDVERLSRLMAGDLSAAEEAALRTELSQNPALQQAYDRLKALAELTASLSPAPSDVALAEQAAARMAQAPARPTWRPVVLAALAAALAAAAVTAWLMWPAAPEPVASAPPPPAPPVPRPVLT